MLLKSKAVFAFVILLKFFNVNITAQLIDTNNDARNEILKFLYKFQEGYTDKDVFKVKEWTKELMTDDVYVIGTNGVFPHTGEW